MIGYEQVVSPAIIFPSMIKTYHSGMTFHFARPTMNHDIYLNMPKIYNKPQTWNL